MLRYSLLYVLEKNKSFYQSAVYGDEIFTALVFWRKYNFFNQIADGTEIFNALVFGENISTSFIKALMALRHLMLFCIGENITSFIKALRDIFTALVFRRKHKLYNKLLQCCS